jgi:hypothetical protein
MRSDEAAWLAGPMIVNDRGASSGTFLAFRFEDRAGGKQGEHR